MRVIRAIYHPADLRDHLRFLGDFPEIDEVIIHDYCEGYENVRRHILERRGHMFSLVRTETIGEEGVRNIASFTLTVPDMRG